MFYSFLNSLKPKSTRSKANGREYVDLGLSSGCLWATCNVGASKPERYGDYFAWGETKPKSAIQSNTYKWGKVHSDTDIITKYCNDSIYSLVDNKITLDLSDDAAHVNWGGDWRMPTKEEQDELRTECTWIWTSINWVKGYIVVGPNGNCIFLPAAGYRSANCTDVYCQGYNGFYWSSSLNTNNSYQASHWVLSYDCVGWCEGGARAVGYSIRPVLHL